jgi:hypothetical protein
MGKLGFVVLLDLGMMSICPKSGRHGHHTSTTTLLLLLFLMTLCCVGNHGSEVRATFKDVVGNDTPLAAQLKQSGGDDGASGNVGVVNGGRAGIESYGNVTVLAGQRSELKCRTFNLANYTVRYFSLF